MGAHLTAEEKTRRDELVAGLLAEAGRLTEYELGRLIRAREGIPSQGIRSFGPVGARSLRRLEAAGRARCVREPHDGPAGFKRVWYPIRKDWPEDDRSHI